MTSRHIHDRLMKELDKNLALRVRKSELEDGKWIVSGRGVLHLSVLIETMRREGYELQVGQPQVIFKEIDGVKCEDAIQNTLIRLNVLLRRISWKKECTSSAMFLLMICRLFIS